MKTRGFIRKLQFLAADPRMVQPDQANLSPSQSQIGSQETRRETGAQRPESGSAGRDIRPPTTAAWQETAVEDSLQSPMTEAVQNARRQRSAVLLVRVKPQVAPQCATRENPWVNSLGMKFVPVPGTSVWFGIWDVRVRDYRAYAYANRGVDTSWEHPEYRGVPVTPSADCPVVNVSWNEAKAFCGWLTRKERGEGKLGENQEYRLPTEAEWNQAVGNAKYPWGDAWPPPNGAGNYADRTLQSQVGGCSIVIEGDDDLYVTTSPVGSFMANGYGLYDLGGNVWQWCEDWFDSSQQYRVLRGASWGGHIPGSLLSSHRLGGAPDRRHFKFGFRCVLGDAISRFAGWEGGRMAVDTSPPLQLQLQLQLQPRSQRDKTAP